VQCDKDYIERVGEGSRETELEEVGQDKT